MMFYHLRYPDRAVESLKEVIVSLVLQLLPVKVSLCKVWQRSNLSVGGIGNIAKVFIDFEDKIGLALGGLVPPSDLYGFL